MLGLKDVLNLIQNLVLQGGKSSNQTSTYRQKHVLSKSWV